MLLYDVISSYLSVNVELATSFWEVFGAALAEGVLHPGVPLRHLSWALDFGALNLLQFCYRL